MAESEYNPEMGPLKPAMVAGGNKWADTLVFTPASDRSYVYVLSCGPVCKIGRSRNPAVRAATLERASGRTIEARWVLIGEYDAAAVENYLHKEFTSQRAKGEWFEVPANDVLRCEIDLTEFPVKEKMGRGGSQDEEFLKMIFPPPTPMMRTDEVVALFTQLAVYGSLWCGEELFSDRIQDFANAVEQIDPRDWKAEQERLEPFVRQVLEGLITASKPPGSASRAL